ncbi:oligopeptide:H+ symporter [Corynebacterium callunae]|uniref:peptide MFS transporter n=1 Tax=Corynebacterium callunae TaxID=1721 RepID=UPI003982B849
MTKIEHRSGVVRQAFDRRRVVASIVSIEMWERFSFYGMQALLAYYLYFEANLGGLGMDQQQATALVGAYGATLYLCCWAGGWVSDRLLGAEMTLLTGAISVSIGHISLALIGGYPGLCIGLTLIALGSGFLKTSAITVLGSSAEPTTDTSKPDPAFQYFYLGINVGALLGPLLTGWLSTRYNFEIGFGTAAILMAIGLGIYLTLRPAMLKTLPTDLLQMFLAPQQPVTPRTALLWIGGVIVIAGSVAALLFSGKISAGNLANGILLLTALAALWLFILPLQHHEVSAAEKKKVLGFIPIFICSTAFWTLQGQTYGVLAVYSQERVNRMLGSFEVPAAWSQSLNPFYILAFSIPLSVALSKLGNHGLTLRRSISLGVIISGSGMLVLIPFTGTTSVPLWVLPLSILLISLGELLIGPGGMAAVAHHAPRAFATRFSALYFLTLAIGMSLAGTMSEFYDPSTPAAEIQYFALIGGATIAIGAITLPLSLRNSDK